MPYVAIALGALQAAGSYMNTLNQAASLKNQASLKMTESKALYEDAANIALSNSINEDIKRRESRLELSEFRARTLSSGLSGGTLIDVDMQTEANMEADILMERYNGHVAFVQKNREAKFAQETAQYMKKQAHRMKSTGWVSSLVGGASTGISAYGAMGGSSSGGKTSGAGK